MKNKQVNILFPFEFNIFEGGAQQSLLQIIKHLNKNHFAIHIFLPKETKNDLGSDSFSEVLGRMKDINVIKKFGSKGYWEFKKKKPLITLFHGLLIIAFLIKYIKKNKIDIIHTNMYVSLFWCSLYKFLFNRFIRIVHHDRGFGQVGKGIISLFERQIDCLICTSDKQLSIWATRSFPKDKLRLIYNTVEVQNDILPQIKRHCIINVGRICQEKNQLLFLKIANYIVNIQKTPLNFLLVGDIGLFKDDQNYYIHLTEYIKNNGLSNFVHFSGHKSKDDLKKIYLTSYALVGCCAHESFGRVFIESMDCGTPVIAVNTGGISSIIEQNVDGFVYPSEDFRAAGDIVLTLLQNKQLYENVRTQAKNKVAYRFNSKTKILEYNRMYSDLIP